ncbi:MAG: hypothetical protein ACT6S0_04615 [Roseateles sp.]|uniref:hypothetical protein n=1 Tax=Roseateles sp. TaxID=1971397 RepID=UPI00403757C1
MTQLSDRERILTTLVDRLSTTMLLRPNGRVHDADSFSDGYGGHYVHFAYYRKPVKGDLVIGKTGRIDQWKVGFYEEHKDPSMGLHVIRDINTGQPCDYGNEEFVPIVGMDPTALLVRDERRVYEKVLEAFAEGDEYLYRFGGFRFDGEGRAVVRVRESHGGFGRESVPFEIVIGWTPEATVEEILAAMRAGGYGTKSFRPEQAPGA